MENNYYFTLHHYWFTALKDPVLVDLCALLYVQFIVIEQHRVFYIAMQSD